MHCSYACNSPEHLVSRRRFLGSLAAGAAGVIGGFGGLVQPAAAKELHKAQKRVLLVWLSGGSSQLETWDPKPGTDTGGPFQAMPTSVPGVHICELLPHTARQMHRMVLVRGVNTFEAVRDDHGRGTYNMLTGQPKQPTREYPQLGSVMAKLLGSEENPLPGYIHITPRGGGSFNKGDAAFLGPKYASVSLGDGKPPANLLRPATLTEVADQQRNNFREHLNSRFTRGRRTADTEA